MVIDASALVEILLRTPADQAARSQVEGQSIVIPDLAYPETVAVLGRLSRSEAITPTQAELALASLLSLAATVWATRDLMARAWRLRDSFSTYDAVYVALAEALGQPLVTHDARLGQAAAAFSSAQAVVI